MTDLKVYQIGLGSFGRHGFEKFIEMHNHLETVDIELKGLIEKDHKKRKAAQKFAEINNVNIDVFSSTKDFYDAASDEDEEVLIYDASPSRNHAKNIYSSVNHGFYHLAEKPPSMTREEHIQERKLAAEKDVFWKVDFIERESPVVKKAVELVEEEDIERIEVYRESSVGLQKLLNPVKRSGVVGGDILDKMSHEIYIYDLLESAGYSPELEYVSGEAEYFMPKEITSDRMMDIYGGSTREIDSQTATGMTRAEFEAEKVEVVLNSSWLGASEDARKWDEKVEMEVVESDFSLESEEAFTNEEARFFVIQGSRNLLGDMLHGRLLDLDSRELIQTADLMHDQLYRVLRKAVEDATDHRRTNPDAEEIDDFMTAIFDARDEFTGGQKDFFEELQKSNMHVKQMTAEGKIIEDSETESITG